VSPAPLSVRALSKSFGTIPVLDRVDVEVAAGQVHGLLGGNGSGKSTLIKILAGVHAADAGTVSHGDEMVSAADLTPRTAARLGLRFVHQDLAVIAELSVAENLSLGRGYPRSRLGGIDWRAVNARAEVVLRRYGLHIDPDQALATLSPSQRTMVAVIRALHDAADDSVLILDEPTATMARAESAELLGMIRRLADSGRAVVFVSHRIHEVLQYTDTLTCLRDGRVVKTRPTAGLDHDDVVALIAGSAPGQPAASHREGRRRAADATDSSVVARFHVPAAEGGDQVEVSVRAGEIVGLAGLVGSGRSRTLRALYGLGDTRDTNTAASPHAAVRRGIAYVPEHRATDALFADHSLVTNIVAARQASYWRGLMRNSAQRRDACNAARDCKVQAAAMSMPISSLSGGNQQKAVLARWLLTHPRLLLLDEPTQGVDVAGRAQIHELIDAQVAHGMAVLMTSSDFEEITELCDRVLVLAHGLAVGELHGNEVSVERMTQLAHSSEPVPDRRAS
jgi:ribose transport system ATP-binding protein